MNKSIVMFFLIVLCCNFSIAEEGLCKKNATLSCLKKNFSILYTTDYKLLWSILNFEAKKLQNDPILSEIVSFMHLEARIKNNAEVSEFFSETIENICTIHIQSCLDSLLKLDDNSMQSIVNKLRQPMFLSKAEINNKFSIYSGFDKYKKIIQFYFSRKPVSGKVMSR